jgi:hypothetical protein
MKITNYTISGIDYKDYPDFCDAYISYAENEQGIELTDEELTDLNENQRDYVYVLILNYIF